MNKDEIPGILADATSLRTFIKTLWAEVRRDQKKAGWALAELDALADVEIKGGCRSEIMQIIDKASNQVGGLKPTLVEVEDGVRMIPIELVKGMGRAPAGRSDNIIQFPRAAS